MTQSFAKQISSAKLDNLDFPGKALLIRLISQTSQRSECIQVLVKNEILLLEFRTQLLFTLKYGYLKCYKKW